MKHNIALFASGKGTNFEAIAAACNRGEINARIVLLVCDKPQAEVVQTVAEEEKMIFFMPASSMTLLRTNVELRLLS